MTNPIDRINEQLAVCNNAWEGPWSWSFNEDERFTLSTHGKVPFDLIKDDENQAPLEEFEFIVAARTGYPKALEALKAVLELHCPDDFSKCEECSDYGTDEYPAGELVEHPCPTFTAVQEAMGDG